MPKAILKTQICFGLVTVPVKIYSAHESNEYSFSMIHDCGTKLRQFYSCPKCNVNASYSTALRGYEFEKGKYVTFEKDELKALTDNSKKIDIEEFVPINKVDRIYFERTYYLGPDTHGDHAYSLLLKALKKEKAAGIGRAVIRSKENLVLICEHDGILVMHKLYFANEIRSTSQITFQNDKVKKNELDLATQIIRNSKSCDVDLKKYKNSMNAKYEKAIKDKMKGKDISINQVVSVDPVPDIMEALKKSIENNDPVKKKKKKKA